MHLFAYMYKCMKHDIHSLFPKLDRIYFYACTHIHALLHIPSLFLTLSLSLSRSLSLSVSYTHTPSLMNTHTHIHKHTRTRTQTRSYTLTHYAGLCTIGWALLRQDYRVMRPGVCP